MFHGKMAQDGLQSLHLSLDHRPHRPHRPSRIAGRRSSPEPRCVFRVSQVPLADVRHEFSSHVFPCRSHHVIMFHPFFPWFSPGSSQVHVGYVPIGSMYAIYGNMDPINIPPMLAYIPYMDPMGLLIVAGCCWMLLVNVAMFDRISTGGVSPSAAVRGANEMTQWHRWR